MNAAEILEEARNSRVRISVEGNGLVLAAPAPPPTGLLAAMVEHKADLIALLLEVGWTRAEWLSFYRDRVDALERGGGLLREDAEALAYQHCVVEWLNQNPAVSDAGQCLVCGQDDGASDAIVPFGVHPRGRSWLHGKCWSQWNADRQEQARKALTLMGIQEPATN
jgi:hypothetical protein